MPREQVNADDELGHALVHEEVDGAPRLVVALAGVDGDPTAFLRELHAHRVRPTRHAVAVHRVLARVDPVGDARLQGLSNGVAALLLEGRPGIEHDVGPETLEQLLHAPLAEPAPGEHGADVALQDVGEPRVAEEHAEGLVVEHALAVDADGRHDDPFVENLGGVGGNAARAQPSDVPEVAPRLGEGQEAAAVEHGGREDHVRRVRDAAARAVTVVVPVEIARPHRLGRILLEDGRHQVAEERDHRAAHHPPPRVEDAGEVVLLFPDEGRHGRALDHRFHLGLGRPQRPPDDLARDRIVPPLAVHRGRSSHVSARRPAVSPRRGSIHPSPACHPGFSRRAPARPERGASRGPFRGPPIIRFP